MSSRNRTEFSDLLSAISTSHLGQGVQDLMSNLATVLDVLHTFRLMVKSGQMGNRDIAMACSRAVRNRGIATSPYVVGSGIFGGMVCTFSSSVLQSRFSSSAARGQ